MSLPDRMQSAIPATMNALVYRGMNDLRLETVPVPRIGSSELLVKVATCGICPTDIKKIQTGGVTPPRIFGHETAGTIVRVGAKVRGFKVNDRVALHHHIPCLNCHYCDHRAFAQCLTYRRTGVTAGFEPAGGGFAEFVRVLPFCLPGVVKIPARNSFQEGALLEPVNTVLKAVGQLRLLRGDTVLVIGQGPIGLLFDRVLDLAGMRVIASDLLQARRKLGRRFGASTTLDPADSDWPNKILRMTRGRGADAVVVAVANDAAVAHSQMVVRGGGQVLLFAHTQLGHESPIDLGRICVQEKALLGSYSSDFTRQREVARLVFGRRVDVRPLVSHEFPLESSVEAIRLVARVEPDVLKVMIRSDTSTAVSTGGGPKTS